MPLYSGRTANAVAAARRGVAATGLAAEAGLASGLVFPAMRAGRRAGETAPFTAGADPEAVPLKLARQQPASSSSAAGRRKDDGMPAGGAEPGRPVPGPQAIDVNLLADKVFDVLEQKIRIERERRGLL